MAMDFLHKYGCPFPVFDPLMQQDAFYIMLVTCVDSAVGPDGIPYSAWKKPPRSCRATLYKLLQTLLLTDLEPSVSLNAVWLALLGKGEDPLDTEYAMSRKASNTRPLSISNTDCKLCAAAVNAPLAMHVEKWALHQQRGFVLGRQLLDNVIDIDAYARTASM